MASFEKRAGHWRVVVRRNGERRSATFTTKAAAVAWAAEQESEILHVKRGGVPRRTLRQAFERYRDEESPKKRGERWEVVRIKAFLGDSGTDHPALFADLLQMPMTEITTTHLSSWRDQRLKAVKASTVNREMNLLSAVFETARREWKWLHENPLRDVRRPPATPARKRRIEPDEQRRVLLALGYDDARPVVQMRHQVAVAWLLAIETAMRQGEVLGLTWSRIRGRVAHLPMTKNGEARDVPLSSRASALLAKLEGLDADRCFTLRSASCDALFRKARDAAGVVGMTFHDSRREGTSRLSKKVDVLTLARITGHKDLNELMTYYQTDMAAVAEQIG